MAAQIDMDAPENQNPQPSEEDAALGVTRMWVPLAGLSHTLARMAAEEGVAIFMGLSALAQGLAVRDALKLTI